MDIKLKSCPFCGGKAKFGKNKENWEWIECESCSIATECSTSTMEDCKPKLAEKWNRRIK